MTQVEIKDRSTSKVIEITHTDGSLVRITVSDNSNEMLITYVDNKPMVCPKASNQILIKQYD